MKVLTVATDPKGYFPILQQSCARLGYDLQVLGWGRPWSGLFLKPDLYLEALCDMPQNDIVMCVDAFDVFMTAHADEARDKFKSMNVGFLASGDREYTNFAWVQCIADKVMTDDPFFVESQFPNVGTPYKRLNSGLLMGYAGELCRVLTAAQQMRAPGVQNDQTVLIKHYLRHPHDIAVDSQCRIFQTLYRSRGSMLWGGYSGHDPHADAQWDTHRGTTQTRLRNNLTGEYPVAVHGYKNLDLTPLVQESGYQAPPFLLSKKLHHFRNHVLYYVKRAPRFAIHYVRYDVLNMRPS